jgi:hypothetical protein
MTDDQILYVIAHREVSYGTLTDRKHVSLYADFHKIGISENPEKRLSVLSGGTPHELEIATTIEVDDASTVEDYLHRINRSFRRDRGEWFRLSRNMRQSLTALDELRGENVKQVYHNWSRLDRQISFYVAIHRARNGELPTWEELVER